MFFRNPRLILAALLLAAVVVACGGRGSSAEPPAGGITATAGDGQVVVTWVPDPGVQYWLFYAPNNCFTLDKLSSIPGHQAVLNVTSPYVLTGLTNGTPYGFVLNGRYDGGPGGPGTTCVMATPRPAGTTWQVGGAMGSAIMRGAAYGAASDTVNYFVVVGDGGAIYRSSDGVTSTTVNWTLANTDAGTATAMTGNQRSVTYGASKFIAVGDAGSVYSSTDALNWTAGTSGTPNNLNAVAASGSRIVAVGDAGTIQYSSDGVTWTAATVPTLPAGTNLLGVTAASSGLWLAVGTGGTALTSSDGGVNWTTVNTGGTAATLYGAAYRGAVISTTTTLAARYVLVGQGGLVLGSTDAVTWAPVTPAPGASDLLAVTPAGGQFVATGAGGVIYTSADGLSWTLQTNTPSTAGLNALVFGKGQYVAVGQAGANIYSR